MRSTGAGGEFLRRLQDAVVRGKMRQRSWNVTRWGSSKCVCVREWGGLGGRVLEQQGMEGTGGWGGCGGALRCFVVTGMPSF